MNRDQQRTERHLTEAAEAHLKACGWRYDPEASSADKHRWVHPRVNNGNIAYPTWDALSETRANPHIKW